MHGLGEHSGRYEHVARFFVQRGYTVALPDLRGHGRSGGPRGHATGFDQLSGDLAAFVAAVQEHLTSGPRLLYGHSMGGSIALWHALRRRHEFDGLIASSPGLRPAVPPKGWKLALSRLLGRVLPRLAFSSDLDGSAISRDPAVVRAYETDPLVHATITSALARSLIECGERLVAKGGDFGTPLLLMHGEADRVTSCEATRILAERVTSPVTLKLWPGFYHELHNEPEREQVLEFVVSWIGSHGT